MVRTLLQMFDFLFAVEHLPAMNAKHFSVGLGFDDFELLYEFFPFCGADFDHGHKRFKG